MSDATGASTAAVLEELFLRYGAPLVLKSDDGSALVATEVQAVLERHEATSLLSPPRRPRYNGALEASNTSMKRRTEYQIPRPAIATGSTVPLRCLVQDLETARLLACRTARSGGSHRPTPQQAWEVRAPMPPELRIAFHAEVAVWSAIFKPSNKLHPVVPLGPRDQAQIRRYAVRSALVQHGLLNIRRRRFSSHSLFSTNGKH